MNLTPQQQRVVDFLADGHWHCMANDFFMKDDRKRISELNHKGFKIIGDPCDRACGKNHSSRVYMRKLVEWPDAQVPVETPVRRCALCDAGAEKHSHAPFYEIGSSRRHVAA